MSELKSEPRLPPLWFMRLLWFTHRRVCRLTGGRVGLWRPKPNGWGAARLTVVRRRTGVERTVMVGYFGRAAHGEERSRLWSRWREIDKNLDAYAARRSTETAVVVLEPWP